MNQEPDAGRELDQDPGRRKRTYSPPVIVEYGALTEVTRGSNLAPLDALLAGSDVGT